MTDLLLGKKVQAHLYIGRIPLDLIPVEEEACAQWLYQLYQKKVTVLCTICELCPCTSARFGA
jgi:lysophosphatidic acid acyltransferase/lysophosphatidylinositol acyltransferase